MDLAKLQQECKEVWGCSLEQITDVSYVMEELDADPEAIDYSIYVRKVLKSLE
jgi:hypothetical protein